MASSHPTTTGTYAPFGRRFAALTIDWVLSYLAAALFLGENPGLWISLVFFVQYTFFTGLFGQTPGMRLMGVAVVRLADGRPLGLPRAALRSFLLNLVLPAVIYGDDRRGLHDKAVGSVVVRA
jgi:uncharacterized RDD family membrane protein YckC